MSNLYIPAGIPGSGKSTWAARALPHAAVVSTDAIRRELAGSLLGAWATPGQAAEINRTTFATFHARIAVLLSEGRDVIADATNLHDFARAELRTIAARAGAQCHLVLFSDLDGAQARNIARDPDQVVPPAAMAKMLGLYAQTLGTLGAEAYASVIEIGAAGHAATSA